MYAIRSYYGQNISYSSRFKHNVVHAYLSGEGSYEELALKFKIPTPDTVRSWVLKYNGHMELKAFSKNSS